MAWPAAARCARIWCWRPVSGRQARRAQPARRSTTRTWVCAGRASSRPGAGSMRMRNAGALCVRSRGRASASGRSMSVSSHAGTPWTTARYSLSTRRRSNAPLRSAAAAGDDQAAEGLAVEPVGDLEAGARPALDEKARQRVEVIARAGVDRQPGRFVDDKDGIVVVEDAEVA